MNLRYCFLIYISLFLISCGSSSDDNHPISRNSFSGTPLSSSLASNSTGAFKGSMAYASDSSMDSGEGVNPSTGSFTFKYDLLNVVGVGNMANTLSMSYNSSDVADAGKGWDFSMPYVNVNSNPRILNIDGAQYIIDPSKGEIGLKYITNRAVKFIQSQMAVSLSMECTNAPAERKYIFKYSDLIGQTNYFFASDGSLAAVSDNHKNCNIYKYTNGKLSEIVDSFGSKFIISNEYNVTKIQGASGDVIARITTDSSGYIQTIQNALDANKSDATIMFNYNSLADGTRVLSNIKYYTGLETVIQYTSLTYCKDSQSNTKKQSVVSDVIHKADGNTSSVKYTYGNPANMDNRNFLGYPQVCIRNGEDSLSQIYENKPNEFKYTVKVEQNDGLGSKQVDETVYNALHLPVSQTTRNGKDALIVNYDYNLQRRPSDNMKGAAYSFPTQIKAFINNKLLYEVNTTYDPDYGLTLTDRKKINNGYGELVDTMYSENTLLSNKKWFIGSYKVVDMLSNNEMKVVNFRNDAGDIEEERTTYTGGGTSKTISERVTYDSRGMVTSTVSTGGGDSVSTQYSYTYKNAGKSNQLTVTEYNASKTRSVVKVLENKYTGFFPLSETKGYLKNNIVTDVLGRSLSVTNAMGTTISTDYLDRAKKVVTKSSTGYSVTTSLDSFGREIEVADNVNGVRKLASKKYNAFGQVVQERDEVLGNTASYTYDSMGRVKTEIDMAGNLTNYSYDDANFTTIVTTPLTVTTSIVDANDNVVSVETKTKDGSSSTKATNKYDGFGRVVETKEYKDGILYATVTNVYEGPDVIKLQTYTTADLTQTTEYLYDGLWRNISSTVKVTTKSPNETTQHRSFVNAYDSDGMLSSSTSPDGKYVINYSYDAAGNLKTKSISNGRSIEYAYDNAGLMIRKTIKQTGTEDIVINSTYLQNSGQVKSITRNGSKPISYDYDKYERLLNSVKDGDVVNVSYTYNVQTDQLQSVRFANGNVTSYTYDSLGNILTITSSGNNNNYTVNHTYGTVNGLNSVPISKKITKDGALLASENYSYDKWMNNSGYVQTIGKSQYSISKSYNSIGQQLTSSYNSQSDGGIIHNYSDSYEYDGLNRLKQRSRITNFGKSGVEKYTYDAGGNTKQYSDMNGVTRTFEFNDIDQIEKIDGKKVSYDKFGNIEYFEDGGDKYFYDGMNLVKVEKPEGSILYTYNSNGLITSRTYLTKSGKKSTTEFTYANSDMVGINDSGQNYFITRNGNMNYFCLTNGSNCFYHMIGSVGSTDQLLKSESGSNTLKSAGLFEYSSYGVKSFDSSDGTIVSQFGWNQEYTDPDTNLVYLRARWYSPKHMAFIAADTVAVANLYNYGNANPIANIDPSGHTAVERYGEYAEAQPRQRRGIARRLIGIAINIGMAVATGGASLAYNIAGIAIDISTNIVARALNNSGQTQAGRIVQIAGTVSGIAVGLMGGGKSSGGKGKSVGKIGKIADDIPSKSCVGGSCTKPGMCFTGDTQILMDTPSKTKKIEDIQVGDLVFTEADVQIN